MWVMYVDKVGHTYPTLNKELSNKNVTFCDKMKENQTVEIYLLCLFNWSFSQT